MLGRAISSHLKPLKEVAEDGFEVDVKRGEIHSCFPMISSYCCDFLEKKKTSAAWLGAGRGQPSNGFHGTYENKVRSRRNSSCVVGEMSDTRRKLVEKQAEAASLAGMGLSTTMREVLGQIVALLSQQSLAKWPCFF